MRPPLPLSLRPTLEAALSRGAVLPHGRLQQLDSRGHVVNDASPVAEPWRAPLADAVAAWSSMEAELPGVQLVSVYARGSIVRGLGLPGVSDVDTLGYAVVDASTSTSQAASCLSPLASRLSPLASRLSPVTSSLLPWPSAAGSL